MLSHLQASRLIERARAEGSVASESVSSSPFARSPRPDIFMDSPKCVWPRAVRRKAFADGPRLGLLEDNSGAGLLSSSPQGRSHAVPEWLNSPRGTSTGNNLPTLDSFLGGGLLGTPQGHLQGGPESISPGTAHRLSVFSHPHSRRVSSEPSAEAVMHVANDKQPVVSVRDPLLMHGDQQQLAATAGTFPEVSLPVQWCVCVCLCLCV